jgi:heterodisulfide reductase subunit A-like polyferredoxin
MTEHLRIRDRLRIESFNRLGEDVVLGAVEIDPAKCTGCGLCVKACAAGTLEIVDKKARMNKDLPICHSCADCVAICAQGAISMKQFLQLKLYFRYLDRGKPEPPRKF